MGRPPIGNRAMTKTERQRRWRERKRDSQFKRPSPEQPRRSLPDDERAAVRDGYQARIARIEELARQLEHVRQELDLAQGAELLRAAGHGNPGRCFLCLKPRDQVKAMFVASRRYSQLFLCNGCIDEMHQHSNESIARQNAALLAQR
jgi:hypothetical protein